MFEIKLTFNDSINLNKITYSKISANEDITLNKRTTHIE